jgi:hypothetical protein
VTEESSLDSDKFNLLLNNKGAMLKAVQAEHMVRIDLARDGDRDSKDSKLTGDFSVKGLVN